MSSKKAPERPYDKAIPFKEVYPEYNLSTLPKWVRDNIDLARVDGKKFLSVVLPDGQRYYLGNTLNHLSGQDWTKNSTSVFCTRYPTSGKESYAHKIRKIHPSPKPPQLMRDLISFFTKENEIVFDCFMGVGGSLLGAALCGRRSFGIDINPSYVEAYKAAANDLNLPISKAIVADSVSFLSDDTNLIHELSGEQISLFLIDPPYADMMSREKTGGDIKKYGKSSTPFTNDPHDLGNMTRVNFLSTLKKCVALTMPFIKDHGYVVVFIKDLQPLGKELNMLHYDVSKTLTEIADLNYKGMRIWVDETAKLFPYGYPYSFVANQIHQYILVFRKE